MSGAALTLGRARQADYSAATRWIVSGSMTGSVALRVDTKKANAGGTSAGATSEAGAAEERGPAEARGDAAVEENEARRSTWRGPPASTGTRSG